MKLTVNGQSVPGNIVERLKEELKEEIGTIEEIHINGNKFDVNGAICIDLEDCKTNIAVAFENLCSSAAYKDSAFSSFEYDILMMIIEMEPVKVRIEKENL